MRKAVGTERMKEREAFLDKLRVTATCAVILLHTITGVMDATDMNLYPGEKRVFLAAMDLVCWSVPVFLMISGYLFLNPRRQIRPGKMLTKYCRRIALALVLFGVPYRCLELIALEGGFRPEMPWEAFLGVLCAKTWSHMWYLYLILFLYLLTPLMKRALSAVPRWAVYTVELVLFVGCSVLPYLYELAGWAQGPALPGDGIYFFYYMCGYLFAVEERRWRERAVEKRILPALTCLLAAGMAISRLRGEYALQMAYNYPFTVLLALLLFAWGSGAEKRPHRKEGRRGSLWRDAAALSFAMYLVHPVFLNFAYKFLHVTPLSHLTPLSALPGIPLLLYFAGTVLASAAAAWILYQIPPLRKYVL